MSRQLVYDNLKTAVKRILEERNREEQMAFITKVLDLARGEYI